MCKALGIVNVDSRSAYIEGMNEHRPLSAVSVLGRYRLIDFVLSNMSNSGISDIQVYFKEKPRSIIQHLSNGNNYELNPKNSRFMILGGETPVSAPAYNHDINAFYQNLSIIEESKQPYVLITSSYFVYPLDYEEVLQTHMESGADITCVYKNVDTAHEEFIGCDIFQLKEKRIIKMEHNRGNAKYRAIGLDTFILSKELFIELIHKARKTSQLYSLKDILGDLVDELNIVGYAYKGVCFCVNNLKQYFKMHMELLDYSVAKRLFKPEWPIMTKTSDSQPTMYGEESDVKRSIVANGCVINGKVENSVIGRGVTIGKNAIVTNCILLPGSYVGENVNLNNVIMDKKSRAIKSLVVKGTHDQPVYVNKSSQI